MKFKDVDLDLLKQHLKVNYNDDDQLLTAILEAGKDYIQKYTSRDIESLNNSDSLSIALLVICADFYEERNYSTNEYKPNMLVENMLNMSRDNLLR